MINLKKEEKSTKSFSFCEKDFANIKWQNLNENKRIFIPYSELPKGNVERCDFLDSLISFIEQKTGKYCSYFLVSEAEPYEVSGFYIQAAPELKDCNGNYIKNDSYVYDINGTKWHVSYYYKDNAPHIILDSNNGDYQVVTSLAGFSYTAPDLISEQGEPSDESSTVDDIAAYYESKPVDNKTTAFNVIMAIAGTVAALMVLFLLGFLAVRLTECMTDFISDIPTEPVNTETGDKSFEMVFKRSLTTAWKTVKDILPRMFLITLLVTSLRTAFKTIKRLMRGD